MPEKACCEQIERRVRRHGRMTDSGRLYRSPTKEYNMVHTFAINTVNTTQNSLHLLLLLYS